MKSPHIIHRLYLDRDDNFKYYCNGACGYTQKKSTYEDNKVTCKNCIKQIKKRDAILRQR